MWHDARRLIPLVAMLVTACGDEPLVAPTGLANVAGSWEPTSVRAVVVATSEALDVCVPDCVGQAILVLRTGPGSGSYAYYFEADIGPDGLPSDTIVSPLLWGEASVVHGRLLFQRETDCSLCGDEPFGPRTYDVHVSSSEMRLTGRRTMSRLLAEAFGATAVPDTGLTIEETILYRRY